MCTLSEFLLKDLSIKISTNKENIVSMNPEK